MYPEPIEKQRQRWVEILTGWTADEFLSGVKGFDDLIHEDEDSRPLAETRLADFDRVLDVNLRGTFLIGREALKRMDRHRAGRLISIVSDLGQ